MRPKSAVLVIIAAFGISWLAPAQTWNISTFAGGALPVNVQGANASLFGPQSGIAVDSAGNVFFADGNTVLELDAASGFLTLVAGNGTVGYSGDGGPATAAQLNHPYGIAVDSAGNVYIASQSDNVIREVSAGVITTVAGTGAAGYSGDNGPALSAQLNNPYGIALDSAGDLYIADAGNSCVRKVSGGVITTVAGNGIPGFSGDGGPATNAQLNTPSGVAVDSAGNLYIADYFTNRIREVSGGAITTVAGNGTAGYSGDKGPATAAQLNAPSGITADSAGNLYIADYYNNRIRKVSGGVMTTVAGTGTAGFSGDNGAAVSARLHSPLAAAVDFGGDVYIADYGNDRIREISGGIIATVAGNGTSGFSGDGGTPLGAQIHQPAAAVADSAGDVYIADTANNRIRRISSGVITTVAGNGTAGFSGDGGSAVSAQMNQPASVALDAAGNLYIADSVNNRIRKVSAGAITTFAGTGVGGFSGDGGPAAAAQFSYPTGIAFDASGNLYISDTGNNRIRKISGATVTTVAGSGTPGFSGDGGPAVAAQLNQPEGIALDAFANLYIADTFNNCIRKVASGTITTVAGSGTAGFSGDNALATNAQLNAPGGVAVSSTGGIYIADTANSRIRRISGGTTISTIAGGGAFVGDNGPSTSALLAAPQGLSLDAAGDVYIADTADNRVRLLTPVPLSITGPASLPGGTVGSAYAGATLTATGGAGGYSWSATGLPKGLTISAAGAVSGTPGAVGTSNPQFTVKDSSGATASGTLSLAIAPLPPLSITGPASLPGGMVGTAYAGATLTATGGAGGYSWSATGLPKGLTIGAAGAVSGTPGAAGTSNPQFTVKDSSGATASGTLSLAIAPLPPLSITGPASLPGGMVGTAYAGATLTATGGAGGYSWSATGLPKGLTIGATGTVSGTPGAVGTSNPQFTVKDSSGATASSTLSLAIAAPTPTITSVAPTSVTAYGAAFKLTVNGTAFLAGSVVQWNGTALSTTVVSGSQLTAQVPASVIGGAGTVSIVVASGGAVSSPFTFTVNPAPPAITAVSPAFAVATGAAFTLIVNGTAFTQTSQVEWNGIVIPTTFVSASQLTAYVAASLIASAGGATILVASGSVSSGSVTFPVNAPPAITSLSPASAAAAGAAFTLTVTGTGFAQGAQVQWNGAALFTTFVSATQLTAAVPATLIAGAGSAAIQVNLAGASSGAMTFPVSPPPAISSLSPATAAMGAAFTLTVNGTGFAAGAVVQWSGSALKTVYVSATQLTAAVTGSLTATAGSTGITVVNAGGGASGAAVFSVVPPAITAGGVVPIYSSIPVIQPGSWISIYGTGLASGTSVWTGNFPTSLGGTSVTINNKKAYLWSVSPTQINLQAPDDTTTGIVNVVVSAGTTSLTSTVTLAHYGPSFSLLPASNYAASVILTPNLSGAYGGGTYDLDGPAGFFAFNTRPVKPGETVELFGVGFGPTNPAVPAGKAFTGAAPTTSPVSVTIGGVAAQVLFSGITAAGEYQINLIVPAVGGGDQPLLATVGGAQTPANVILAVQ